MAALGLRCSQWLSLVCKDFSLQCTGSRVAGCRLNHPVVCEILVAQPGMELESPEREGRFLSTGPAGKSPYDYFKPIYLLRFWRFALFLFKIISTPQKRHKDLFHIIFQGVGEQGFSQAWLWPSSRLDLKESLLWSAYGIRQGERTWSHFTQVHLGSSGGPWPWLLGTDLSTSPGCRSLVGYSPWEHKRVGHDLVNKQQQQIFNFSKTVLGSLVA